MIISYEQFRKLNNEQKMILMKNYNAEYYNRFSIDADGTVTIRWIDNTTTMRRIDEIMCADFWAPYQSYDFIEYCHWRMKGCSDDEALCRAICN